VEEGKKKGRSGVGLGTVMEGEGEGDGEGGGGGEGEDYHDGGEGGEEEKVGQKRKRYITVVEGGKKRKVVDIVGCSVFLVLRVVDLYTKTAFVSPGATNCY
jgi:hypothetical protein